MGLSAKPANQKASICLDTLFVSIAFLCEFIEIALEKIHHLNQRIPMNVPPAFNSLFIAEPRNVWQSIGNLFQTHPPLEARLMNLIGRPSTGLV